MKRNNKNNNKNTKVRKYKTIKIKYMNSITNHRYLIRNHFKIDSEYQTQNVTVDLAYNLTSNKFYQNLSLAYQYFKLANIRIDFMPTTVNGTEPPVGHIAFLGNQEKDTLFSDIPLLPYAKRINNKKYTSYLFTRPGRQDDFNYWYNAGRTDSPLTAFFKMHFESTFSQGGGYYVVRLGYDIRFDKPWTSEPTKKAQEKYEMLKPTTENQEIIDKDEEEFNKAFEEIPEDESDV